MSWTAISIPRRNSGVGMPERCIYCNERAEQDLPLRAHRTTGVTKGQFTTTRTEEHLEIEVPYCRRDAARSLRMRMEIRRLGFVAAAFTGLLAMIVLIVALDAPLGVRIVLGLIAGLFFAAGGLLAAGVLIHKIPRYRDWGAGLLGIDLAAGQEALTFRFTNATYAAMFRSRNGLLGPPAR
jgi:hypothetical protein